MPPVRTQKTNDTAVTSSGFKRKPGRPKKEQAQTQSTSSVPTPSAKRGRGRPRKDQAQAKPTNSASALSQAAPSEDNGAELAQDAEAEPAPTENKKVTPASNSNTTAVAVKTNNAKPASASEPAHPENARPRKHTEQGTQDAYFSNNHDWEGRYRTLSTKTKKLKFGGQFVLSE